MPLARNHAAQLFERDASGLDLRKAVRPEWGHARLVRRRQCRVGGFSEAIAVHDICERYGVPVWCGGMLETGIGRAHNIALSTLPNFRLPGDVSASQRYWEEDIVDPEVEVTKRGTIVVSNSAGSGYIPKKDLIEKLTLRKEVVRSRAATV